jgi:hypothetical protein
VRDRRGLLIDVVADPDIPVPVGAIDVWVGEPSTLGPSTFLRLHFPDDAQAVREWPFQILVEPMDRPRTVWVGAFGYPDVGAVGGEPVAMGAIAAPVEIVPGELRHATLALHRYFAPEAECLFDPSVGIAIVPDVNAAGLDCDDDGATTTDCNDLDPAIHPDAHEDCDGLDNNCDGICDDDLDADQDGYSRCTYEACGPPACVDGSDPAANVVGSCDCDDANPLANPSGVEEGAACDGVDHDCDPQTGSTPTNPNEQSANQIDDDCNGVCDVDNDADLIALGLPGDPGLPGSWSTSCEEAIGDCDDNDGEAYANALERCDGKDNDCDETTFGANGPCFIPVADGCQLGVRTCGEVVGVSSWETCLTPSGISFDESVCSMWAQVQGKPWPEQEWYDLTGDDGRDTCTLEVWRAPSGGNGHVNAMCGDTPMTRIHPPFVFDQGCTTEIAGGGARGGYLLELRDRDTNQRGARVQGCDVDLVVLGVDGVGLGDRRLPSIWVVVLQSKPDGTTAALPVEIRVHYADASTAFACPSSRSFDCD